MRKLKIISTLLVCAILIGSCGKTDQTDYNKIVAEAPFEINEFTPPVFKDAVYNIVDYGARGDGVRNNAEAINNAITECNKNGGGKVIIPNGIWISGPIVLLGNVNLYLEKNAVLYFIKDRKEFPVILSKYEERNKFKCHPQIYAVDQKNIAITGAGIIDGTGEYWRHTKKSKMTSNQWNELIKTDGYLSNNEQVWHPVEKEFRGRNMRDSILANIDKGLDETAGLFGYDRPRMFLAENCKKILLQGVTFQNSPTWCIHPLLCENVMLIDVIIRNPWYSQNGDGLDLESCKHSLVYNCIFDVGDDAICIKSGKDKEGRDRGVPTEKLVVAKNTVYHGHGGFTIGSEMSGGVKDVYVTDCKFLGTDIGLRFKSAYERGGVVENIHINNIYMTNIPTDAIRFTMAYQGKAPTESEMGAINSGGDFNREADEKIPTFKNFNISDITILGARTALNIIGIPGPFMKEISIKNMVATTTKGVECSAAQDILLENIQFIVSQGPTICLSNTQRFSLKNSSTNLIDEAFIEILDPLTTDIIFTDNELPEGMMKVKEFEDEVK